jgi:hypothetical protein
MKRDIRDFVSQKRRFKYYTVNKLPVFLDAPNANLFVMQRQDFKSNIGKVKNGDHFLFDNF